MTRLNRSHALTAIVATLAAGAVVGGVAIATQESPTIEACVNQAGIPRFVSDTDDCRSNETHVSWNKVGPQGLQGEPGKDGVDGVDGKDGLDGKDGSPGLSEVYRTSGSKMSMAPQQEVTATDFCFPGWEAIGGGFATEGDDVRVLDSRPSGATVWQVRAINLRLVTGSRWVQAHVVCAKVG